MYYGLVSSALDHSFEVWGGDVLGAIVNDLPQGTWWFTVTAFDRNGLESAPAGLVSKVIL